MSVGIKGHSGPFSQYPLNPVVVPVSLSFVRAPAHPGYPGLKGRKKVVVVIIIITVIIN